MDEQRCYKCKEIQSHQEACVSGERTTSDESVD
jgi:hypothetical protein